MCWSMAASCLVVLFIWTMRSLPILALILLLHEPVYLTVCSQWRVSVARFKDDRGCRSLHYGDINMTSVLCAVLLEERIISHLCGFLHAAHIITLNYYYGFGQLFSSRICFVKHLMWICQNEEITLSSLTWFLQRAALTTGVHVLFCSLTAVATFWNPTEVHVCLWFLLN